MLNTDRLISVFIPNFLAFFANLPLRDDVLVVKPSNVEDAFLSEQEVHALYYYRFSIPIISVQVKYNQPTSTGSQNTTMVKPVS